MIRILKISLFVVFVLAILGLMGFIYIENGNQQLADVSVRIDRMTENGFLKEDKLLSNWWSANDSVSQKLIREDQHFKGRRGSSVKTCLSIAPMLTSISTRT